jgi:hypothetical protein
MEKRKNEKSEIWLEYLYDGPWLVRKHGKILMGYKVNDESCLEPEMLYGLGVGPDFYELAEQLGLKPVKVECIRILFENKVGKK